MGNEHMGPPVCEQTEMTKNITFSKLRWRAVTTDSRRPCVTLMFYLFVQSSIAAFRRLLREVM